MSRLFFIPRRRVAKQSPLLFGAFVVSISFGFAPRCLAQPLPKPAAAPLASPSALVQKTLPSGLRLLVQPRVGTALVSVAVSVRAGTAMESAQNNGVAHFIEHLVFKGTLTGKPGDLDAQMESLGGELTARTSRDQTLYTATVPQYNWQKALPVFADLLLRPAFRADDMASERRVIAREQAAALTEPARTGFGQLAGFAYPENSAYRLPLMGTDEAVARLTPDDLTAFWKQWYTPQNLTLVVVGDVSPSDVETLAASLFPAAPGAASALPALTPPQAEPAAPPVAAAEAATDAASLQNAVVRAPGMPSAKSPQRDLTSVYLGFFVPAPPAAVTARSARAAPEKQQALLRVLARYLSRAANEGQLDKTLITDPTRREAIEVNADCVPGKNGDLLFVSATFAPENAPRAETRLADALRRVREDSRQDDISPAVAEAKQTVSGQIRYENETVEGQARFLAQNDLLHPATLTASAMQAFIDAITPADIRDALFNIVTPARYAVALVGPASPKPSESGEGVRQ